ncbi:MAG: DUF2059 domain-containing protein [Proteobacteria bacterium]|nr:DUF2059 domain-containing protein [Pseudomonadota bacterium]
MKRRLSTPLATLLAMSALAAVPVRAETPPAAPAAPAAASDPARLAAAHALVDAILPPGSYARMMSGSLQPMMERMNAGMSQLPLRDLVAGAGLDEAAVARLGKTTAGEIMAIIDPAFAERQHRMFGVVLGELTKVMTASEPELRDAMAEAYARRFTLDQLNDINHFFASPSGQAYATNALTLMSDPALAARMQSLGPRIAGMMPEILAKARQSAADLPPMKGLKDLTPAERKRLAELLGVPEKELGRRAGK